MRSQPLWIIGAPRSGTTFLTAVLNSHPMITLTNESRIFVLLKQLIEIDCVRHDLLSTTHCRRFTAFLTRQGHALIERYYREELGVLTPIWGDKHPPYADPTVLSGRRGATPNLPTSGSCLSLIHEMLPMSKFIHIRRDPEHVAHSLYRKKWVCSVTQGLSVWQQYIAEIDRFFQDVEASQQLTISYLALLKDPNSTAATLADFLGLSYAYPFLDFLKTERNAPTPFSAPVRNLVQMYRALSL